jgi:site-specific recombinase XerD
VSIKAVLEFLKERVTKSDHVFVSMRNSNPLTGNRHWFSDAAEKAGVKDFTWHCLRHTFGSRLAARGVDLRKIQELMGHKTLAVTVRYTHLSQPDLLAAVEQPDLLLAVDPLVSGQSATRSATQKNMAHKNEENNSTQIQVIQ